MDLFTKKSSDKKKKVEKDVEDNEIENEEVKRSWFGGSKQKKATKKEESSDSKPKPKPPGMTVDTLLGKLKGVLSKGFVSACELQIKKFDQSTPPEALTKLGKRIDDVLRLEKKLQELPKDQHAPQGGSVEPVFQRLLQEAATAIDKDNVEGATDAVTKASKMRSDVQSAKVDHNKIGELCGKIKSKVLIVELSSEADNTFQLLSRNTETASKKMGETLARAKEAVEKQNECSFRALTIADFAKANTTGGSQKFLLECCAQAMDACDLKGNFKEADKQLTAAEKLLNDVEACSVLKAVIASNIERIPDPNLQHDSQVFLNKIVMGSGENPAEDLKELYKFHDNLEVNVMPTVEQFERLKRCTANVDKELFLKTPFETFLNSAEKALKTGNLEGAKGDLGKAQQQLDKFMSERNQKTIGNFKEKTVKGNIRTAKCVQEAGADLDISKKTLEKGTRRLKGRGEFGDLISLAEAAKKGGVEELKKLLTAAEKYDKEHPLDATSDSVNEAKLDNVNNLIKYAKTKLLALEMEKLGEPASWTDQQTTRAKELEAQSLVVMGTVDRSKSEGQSCSRVLKDANRTARFILKPEAKDSVGEVFTSCISDLIVKQTGLDLGCPKTTLASFEPGPPFPDDFPQNNGKICASIQEMTIPNLGEAGDYFQLLAEDPVKLAKELKRIPTEDVQQMAVLDWVTLQTDRNPGNAILVEDNESGALRMLPIDHGVSCHDADKTKTSLTKNIAAYPHHGGIDSNSPLLLQLPAAREPLTERVVAGILAMDADKLADGMTQAGKQLKQTNPDVGKSVADDAPENTRRSVKFLQILVKNFSSPTAEEITLAYAVVFGDLLVLKIWDEDACTKTACKGFAPIREFVKLGGDQLLSELGWEQPESMPFEKRLELARTRQTNPKIALEYQKDGGDAEAQKLIDTYKFLPPLDKIQPKAKQLLLAQKHYLDIIDKHGGAGGVEHCGFTLPLDPRDIVTLNTQLTKKSADLQELVTLCEKLDACKASSGAFKKCIVANYEILKKLGAAPDVIIAKFNMEDAGGLQQEIAKVPYGPLRELLTDTLLDELLG